MICTLSLDHESAGSFISGTKKKWDAIFICNSVLSKRQTDCLTKIKLHANSYICLWFDDIDFPLSSYILPDEKDVKSALSFAMGKQRVLITCQNGMTRSTALSYLIRCIDHSPELALESIGKTGSHPNRRIVELGSKLLENEEILCSFESWQGSPNK